VMTIALSKANPEAPEFYITGNLPDGTTVNINVEGIPDTLLNHLSFGTRIQVTLNKKFAKSIPVRFPDGRPMPLGQYKVEATANQISARRSYFLGGAKTPIYTQRLKEFHDRLTEKSKQELDEIQQLADTLESQLTSTRTQFDLLRKKKTGRTEWATFQTSWKAFNNKLGETFAKWTPVALQSEYFHGTLYASVLTAAQTVDRVHLSQSVFFSDPRLDVKSFDIQLGEAHSAAQSSLAGLKSRLEKVKAIPPSPNGMPQRETP
jgi:hypothetical protein